MYVNGRNGESLSRRDALEISAKVISLLDRRTLATKLQIESVEDLEAIVVRVAEGLTKYIVNGSAGNGFSLTLIECGMCFEQFPEEQLYDFMTQNGKVSTCRNCFDSLAGEPQEKAVDVGV